MANGSKQEREHVLALLGQVCINRPFREAFFADPVAAASTYYDLTTYERAKLQAFVQDPSRAEDIEDAAAELEAAMNCPVIPCPEPLIAREHPL
jgi:hypothetical protein